MTKQVFVSYSTQDTASAEQIRDGLEAGDGSVPGLSCWMAPRDIAPGLDYGTQIIEAIENCTVLLLILSESSNHSQYVRNEVERAVAKRKVVIPVRIQDVPPSRSLEFFISNAQWVDALSGVDAAIGKLLVGLRLHMDNDTVHEEDGPTGLAEAAGLRLRHNLPAPVTPFVGRLDELAALRELLGDPSLRLITVVGPGGMGKTRLALESGRQWIQEPGHFADGIYFIPLAPLRSTDQIAPAVADAVGFQLETGQQTRSPEEQLRDYLAAKEMLLILDNFEHLVSGAGLVTRLLVAAPGLQVLATSRERLHLQNEQVYPIQGLGFPQAISQELPETPEDMAEYTAVQLFLQSARRVAPSFSLHAEDLIYLTRICRLVAGMPLGIELAAGWVDMLPLDQIAQEIQASLDFLETQAQDVPDRHRSMRAVFDYSWQRLTGPERESLARISVFRGGFHREAAREIAGASIRALASLAAKSLLQINAERSRYEVHELIRQYSAEKLGQQSTGDRIRDHHAAYFLSFVQHQMADLTGRQVQARLAEVGGDLENIRAAWVWAIQRRQVKLIGPALDGLSRFYEWQGRYEDGEATSSAAVNVAASACQPRVEVNALIWQASFYHKLGQMEQVKQNLRQSVHLLAQPLFGGMDTRREQAVLQQSFARLARYTGDGQAARQHYEDSLALYQELDDQLGAAGVLAELGSAMREKGQIGTAAERHRQLTESEQTIRNSLEICRRINYLAGVAEGLRQLGNSLLDQARYDAAQKPLEESVALYTELQNENGLMMAQGGLGLNMAMQGRYREARSLLNLTMNLAQKSGYQRWIGMVFHHMGIIELCEGAYAEARHLLLESVSASRTSEHQSEVAIALALLGFSDRGLGNDDKAYARLAEGLRLGIDTQFWSALSTGVALWALLLVDRGEVVRAAEYYALCTDFWQGRSLPWFDDIAGRYIAAAVSALPADVQADASERGQARHFLTTAQEILDEIEAHIDE